MSSGDIKHCSKAVQYPTCLPHVSQNIQRQGTVDWGNGIHICPLVDNSDQALHDILTSNSTISISKSDIVSLW